MQLMARFPATMCAKKNYAVILGRRQEEFKIIFYRNKQHFFG